MLEISYTHMFIFISLVWLMIRGLCWLKNKRIDLKREGALLLVYICILVVVRFTFCPFGKADGRPLSLLFDKDRIFPLWVNLRPFIYLFDYPTRRQALLNLIGNTAMFIPLGIVWPTVFKKLDSHKKVIAAGIGFSLCIEILQLPFYDRVSDIDDLILNSLGFVLGYLPVVIIRKLRDREG